LSVAFSPQLAFTSGVDKSDDFLTLVEPWRVIEGDALLETRIFTVRARDCASPTHPDKAGRFTYLDTTDWVNVAALTREGQVVMIEQFRHGRAEVTLELPGGMVDPGEEPLAAALRELREETGYAGEQAELIGVVTPNPALQNNRCHTALVQNCRREHKPCLDSNEEIAVRLVPLADIPGLVGRGLIHHALVVAAFFHLWAGGHVDVRCQPAVR
jgi:8-oxo-dGTP pyrophosphatase MutT (NUDIX family)